MTHILSFLEFYNKVLENYVPEYPPDRFPIDKRNVKFYSNEKFHKIFIGNGSEDIYEVSFMIESLNSYPPLLLRIKKLGFSES